MGQWTVPHVDNVRLDDWDTEWREDHWSGCVSLYVSSDVAGAPGRLEAVRQLRARVAEMLASIDGWLAKEGGDHG